jgi:hypothetical protein
MNRDWFARTQPETDGKLAVLNQYPPFLYIDAHEMGGTSYFFPPNADPIYHEITDESVDWINNLYGYEYDNVMRAPDPSRVAVSYPPADSPDWFTSGFQRGAEELGGSAAVVDEVVGAGRAVIFAGEPNFRAFTDGTAKLVFNAIVGPDPTPVATASAQLAGERAAAQQSATVLPAVEEPIRVSGAPGAATQTAAVLRGFGARWIETRSAERVAFLVDNPRGLSVEEHPWARKLPAALDRAGVRPIAVVPS